MKDLLKSKTFWTGVAMFLVAGVHAVRANVPMLAGISDETWKEIMQSVQLGGTGMVAIFLKIALGKAMK